MPAILKGWVDRVFAYGFAYGVGEHSDKRWGDRYGEGTLAGKRAMLIVTAGGWEEHYAARGVNGPIDDLLFPINHGILYYPGYDVLPPFVAYRVDRLDEAGFEPVAERLRERMRTLATTAPIPYRQQNGGDYLIPSMQLRPGLDDPGAAGFALHQNGAGADPSRRMREIRTTCDLLRSVTEGTRDALGMAGDQPDRVAPPHSIPTREG
jgi:NAD(P)H dehydrogenase (quinone)